MPETSQHEKKLMGIVQALQKGDMKTSQASGKAKEKKVKKENLDGALATLYMVKKPYTGCQLTSLVEPIDPLIGLGGSEIVPDQVHGVYADQDQADVVANELYEAYCEEESMLEEKKGQVGDKIKKAIDQLEKKHKEHINLAKEDPKNASKHKERIAKIAHQIDDLMTKLEKIEKSKKEIKKDEEKKDLNENKKKDTYTIGDKTTPTGKVFFIYNNDTGTQSGNYKTKEEAKKALDKKQNLKEAFEVHFSDGIRQSKKFKDPKAALSFAKELISTNKNIQNVDVFNAGPNFNSTADTDSVIAWWGDGSYMDNKSKKDPKLAAKKIK